MENDHYLKRELYAAFATQDRYFDFLKASLDGIWYWDLVDGNAEWMSPSFWKLFGIDPKTKQHLASEWQDIIFPEDLDTAMANFNAHLADPNHPYDQIVRYRHADGGTVTVRCRGLIIRDAAGTPIRMLGIHTDLTELEKTRQQLADANAKLTSDLDTAEKLSAQKSAFMSMMSHEIRTPLNAIIGLLDLIAATAESDKQRERAEKGSSAALHLSRTLTTILDASRLEAGRIVNNPRPVALNTLQSHLTTAIEGAQIRYQRLAKQTVTVTGFDRDMIHIDDILLLQVASNLIDNAVKFSQSSAPTVCLARSPDADNTLVLSVTDQGPGIPEDMQTQIFDPFTQIDTGPTRGMGGTGLGLSIVRQIVGELGGKITIDSKLGRGSTFEVSLPYMSVTDKEA